MPDLHPGKGIPIGAVVMTDESVAYPQLVDNDIGCGMSFIKTSTKAGSLNINKLKKLAENFVSIDCPHDNKEAMLKMNAEPVEWGSH
jgi:release factor H-coupled RctB family protein